MWCPSTPVPSRSWRTSQQAKARLVVPVAAASSVPTAGHRSLHLKYKPDDNAQDNSVAAHRARNPAANHAAESIVIYDLQKAENYE